MKIKLTRSQAHLILLSTLIFGAFYAMNHWAFINRDDYSYLAVYSADGVNYDSPLVTSLWDCVVSQYHHYQVCNGRVVIHTLVQFFSGILGRGWFNWANAIIFLLYIFCAARLTASDRKLRALNLFFTFIFCWFLLPDISDATIWLSGSLNYLWPTTLFLYYILYYKRFATNDYPLWALPLLFLLGVLSGWTHEIPTLSILGGFVLTRLFVHRQRLNRQECSFLIGLLIGIFFLCMAPGNAQRVNVAIFSPHRFFLEVVFIAKNMLVSWALLLAYLLYSLVKRRWNVQFLKEESLLIGTMLSAMFLCLVLQQCAGRMYFLPDTLAIILIVRFLMRKFPQWTHLTKRLVVSFLVFLFIVSLVVNVKGVMAQWAANEEFNRVMFETQTVISERVVVKPPSRFALLIVLDDYAEPAYCTYYGLPRVEVRPEGLFERISPVDTYCVEANRLVPNLPLYGTSDSDCWVLKLPKRSGEEINLLLAFCLNERWDRSIRYKLGLMKQEMEVILNRNFYDYSDGFSFYYFIQKSRMDFASDIVKAEVVYCD